MIIAPTVLRFRRLGMLTIVAVYTVILAGGIVRASGSGMGCPDWPTCFGRWIPPTEESQLAPNYRQIYAERGYQNTRFNPTKTWIEYVNRLIGVTIGLLIFLTAYSARIFLSTDKTIFYLSWCACLLVGFQGWLGAVVVASNLKPFLITLHMLLALVIVATLIYAIARSQKNTLLQIDCQPAARTLQPLLKIAIGLTLVQIMLGAQVREAVDFIAADHQHSNRELWVANFPIIFYIHRSFSVIILATNLWLYWRARQLLAKNNRIFRCCTLLMLAIGFELLVGICLEQLNIPAALQPIHLLLANLIFGLQFFIYICLSYAQFNAPSTTCLRPDR